MFADISYTWSSHEVKNKQTHKLSLSLSLSPAPSEKSLMVRRRGTDRAKHMIHPETGTVFPFKKKWWKHKATVCFFWLLSIRGIPIALAQRALWSLLARPLYSKQLLLHHAHCSMGAKEDSTSVSYGWLWLAMVLWGAMAIPGAPDLVMILVHVIWPYMAIDVEICFTEFITVPFHYSAKVHPKSRLQSNVHDLQVQRQVLQNREATQTTSTIEFNGSNGGDGDNYLIIPTGNTAKSPSENFQTVLKIWRPGVLSFAEPAFNSPQKRFEIFLVPWSSNRWLCFLGFQGQLRRQKGKKKCFPAQQQYERDCVYIDCCLGNQRSGVCSCELLPLCPFGYTASANVSPVLNCHQETQIHTSMKGQKPNRPIKLQ